MVTARFTHTLKINLKKARCGDITPVIPTFGRLR
jgi:hypothetical protein